jgi:two-component system, response regulator PdtaR
MSVKSIMVVEDENIIALDIKNRLRRLGYNIIAVVPNGEEAIRVAEELKPDLVLMDILLRGNMNGVEAARRITEDTDIPVIFLSSFSDEDTLRQADQVSHYGYLIKPFNEKELIIKIDKIVLKQKTIAGSGLLQDYSTSHP